jgi:hypothetical protein
MNAHRIKYNGTFRRGTKNIHALWDVWINELFLAYHQYDTLVQQ